jgi:hypothetical protein
MRAVERSQHVAGTFVHLESLLTKKYGDLKILRLFRIYVPHMCDDMCGLCTEG